MELYIVGWIISFLFYFFGKTIGIKKYFIFKVIILIDNIRRKNNFKNSLLFILINYFIILKNN